MSTDRPRPFARPGRASTVTRMAKIFVTPPGWPAPPKGWSPPAGWEPDPTWPAPPAGWELVQRANPRAFRTAFAITTALFVVVTILVLASSQGALLEWGVVIGRLLWVVLFLPGVIVGAFARVSSRRWGWGRYALAVLAAEFTFLLLNSAGALSNAPVEA